MKKINSDKNFNLNKDLELYFKNLRNEFPILNKKINDNNLIYVDNAATTQKPNIVINGICNFYKNDYANIHRGIHSLSSKATNMFENTRKKTANLINAKSEKEIIFTNSATNSINIIGNGLKKYFNEGDEIILTETEHHANLVIWQNLSKELNLKIKFIKLNKNFELDLNSLKNILSNKTKLVSISHVSNVIGTINDIEKIVKIIKKDYNPLILVDGSASIPYMKIDVQKLDIDFFVFSAHKIFGPAGVGILYGKYDSLNLLNINNFGGSMIEDVSYNNYSLNEIPFKFEPGTPNIEGIVGFGYAIDFINSIGYENIIKKERFLMNYFLNKINNINSIEIYGKTDDIKSRVPIFSFNIKGIHPHDVSSIFDKHGIAIRTGHHCAMPLHLERLKINASNRISFSIYNSKEEIDYIIELIKKIHEIFKKGDFLF